MEKKEYNCGLDLLKIVAMLLIVCVHFTGHMNYAAMPALSANWFSLHLFATLGFCGVNIYGMISGYVHAGSKGNFKRGLSLWLCVWFYSVLSLLLSVIFKTEPFSALKLVSALCPFFSGRYWYFTAYIGLMFLQPWLCQFMKSLSLTQTRQFLFSSFVLLSIIGWLGRTKTGIILGLCEGYSTLWLSILYCVGFSIKEYGDKLLFDEREISQKYCIFVLVFSVFGVLMSAVGIHLISMSIFKRPIGVLFFYSYLSPLIHLVAISLFLLFEKLGRTTLAKAEPTFFRYLASLTFGIYIIHESSFFKHFWPDIKTGMYSWLDRPVLFACGLIIGTVAIFLLCGIVEAARKALFKLLHIDDFSYSILNKLISLKSR